MPLTSPLTSQGSTWRDGRNGRNVYNSTKTPRTQRDTRDKMAGMILIHTSSTYTHSRSPVMTHCAMAWRRQQGSIRASSRNDFMEGVVHGLIKARATVRGCNRKV